MVYIIVLYKSATNKFPFDDWLDGLDDAEKILIRLGRLKLGNLGNCKKLGEGISELKIDHGPGYRVYYSLIGKGEILILCGGIKRTQSKDIEKAKNYLKDYKMRRKKDEKN